MNLTVGTKVCHRTHGIGVIVAVDTKTFDKGPTTFFVVEIQDNGAPKKVFVPMASASERLRTIGTAKAIDDALRAPHTETVDQSTWARRYREFMGMIQTGEFSQVLSVVRSLIRLAHDKDLSFGERKLLDQAIQLARTEVAIAKNISEAKAEEIVRGAL